MKQYNTTPLWLVNPISDLSLDLGRTKNQLENGKKDDDEDDVDNNRPENINTF